MPDTLTTAAVTVPGGTFHCLMGGPKDAPLVLILHGFPDYPPTFTAVLERVCAAGYRAVAPWLRGYRPSVLTGPFTLERLAIDALEIAYALAPGRPVHLVGHDWGAAIAHLAATSAPHSVASLTRLALPHPLTFAHALATQPTQRAHSWYMLLFQSPRVPEWLCADKRGAFLDLLWRTWSPGYRMPPAEWAALQQCLTASMPAPLQYYRSIIRPFAPTIRRVRQGARERVTVPTLHIHGADDGCVRPAATDGQERWHVGPFTREIWPGVGHFLHLEAPERVADRILDHLVHSIQDEPSEHWPLFGQHDPSGQ